MLRRTSHEGTESDEESKINKAIENVEEPVYNKGVSKKEGRIENYFLRIRKGIYTLIFFLEYQVI